LGRWLRLVLLMNKRLLLASRAEADRRKTTLCGRALAKAMGLKDRTRIERLVSHRRHGPAPR
jgi:hypothetical protein